MIIDANSLPRDTCLTADVCIVGSGAARIPLALDLSARGRSVLLLEAGFAHLDARTQALYAGEEADAWGAGPPLKAAEKLLDRAGIRHGWLPNPLPPSLLRLWAQDIRIGSGAAATVLGVAWSDYRSALEESCHWFNAAA